MTVKEKLESLGATELVQLLESKDTEIKLMVAIRTVQEILSGLAIEHGKDPVEVINQAGKHIGPRITKYLLAIYRMESDKIFSKVQNEDFIKEVDKTCEQITTIVTRCLKIPDFQWAMLAVITGLHCHTEYAEFVLENILDACSGLLETNYN